MQPRVDEYLPFQCKMLHVSQRKLERDPFAFDRQTPGVRKSFFKHLFPFLKSYPKYNKYFLNMLNNPKNFKEEKKIVNNLKRIKKNNNFTQRYGTFTTRKKGKKDINYPTINEIHY